MSRSDPLVPGGDGHTPLEEDDRQGLKLSYVTTRGELNEAEQENIVRAVTGRRAPSVDALLTDRYLRDLHKSMFGDVWTWAGTYRRSATNIGAEPSQISESVRNLVNDVRVLIDAGVESDEVIAIRLHHRLVSIHPFPNGNGRHSRVAADDLAQALGHGAFSWGARLGVDAQELRSCYLSALRRADEGDLDELVAFARS